MRRDQVRDHDVATPKEPVPIIGPYSAWKPPIPYAIKNQRGASKIPPNGSILRSKSPFNGA